MCAIIDNDVSHQVFGANPTASGLYFRDWLSRQNGGIIVAGGRLFRELVQNPSFQRFFEARQQAGRAIRIPDAVGDAAETELQNLPVRSNDTHVLALARVSGARLLFTNDRALQDDFRDRSIIGGTRGRVYTTRERSDVRNTHRNLLNRADLCDG